MKTFDSLIAERDDADNRADYAEARLVKCERERDALRAAFADTAWQFNEAVSLLREALATLRLTGVASELREEINAGLPPMQAALEACAALASAIPPTPSDDRVEVKATREDGTVDTYLVRRAAAVPLTPEARHDA